MSLPNPRRYRPDSVHSATATTAPSESMPSMRSCRSAREAPMILTQPFAIWLVGVTMGGDHGSEALLIARSVYGLPSVRGPRGPLHDSSATTATSPRWRMGRLRYRQGVARWEGRGAPGVISVVQTQCCSADFSILREK